MGKKNKENSIEQPEMKKQGKKPKMKNLLGDHKPTAVLTAVNFVTTVVWLITYIGCTIMRANVFNQAIERMATATENYTVTVTSPVFGVLRGALYVMPILWVVWGIFVTVGDKKTRIADKKLLFVVIALIVATCFTALLDVARLGVFSYL